VLLNELSYLSITSSVELTVFALNFSQLLSPSGTQLLS